ncbi:4-hydroxyphenylacetate 3-monooxygenase, oxygenase component [Mesobacillus maritimus]|uniref:4-hydroxyphenylacetate 3-monooxygenase, oxygenase component n=1 Tax=Mesobacillus maritimus TaxID=1643336 RepID=UPI00203BC022|nr:4-hydroxyphenylacetate 3-monooxygenase, oxygenase component [Mesobacillus maritimus]MCM3586671.1 4-hydroxyphenylacetate 3-monooxygenase, oxygenase component [Mesobacillus maritimus]
MSACDGATYLQRIGNLDSEIWLDGQKINGNLCDHYAFKGILKSKAKLFDMQLSSDKVDFMTFKSPLTGERVGTSFMEPRSKEDLERRRLTTQEWAKTSGGMMGRSPDYMNTGLMALAAACDVFEDDDCCDQRIKMLYETAREKDLTFSHTFVNPQVNRSSAYLEKDESLISARIVNTTSDGIIMKGARLLATQGGITDELLVLPIGGKYIDEASLYAFSIPSDTKNLKFICRESFTYRPSQFDHPLASRFEEIDTIVVFDDVLVPWERVFLYKNYNIVARMYEESQFNTFLLHQTVARQTVKTEFLLGVAQLIVDTIDIGEYLHVKEKVSELIIGYETMKSLLLASELEATVNQRGTMIPDANPLYAAITSFPRFYPRFTEILQLLGASGLISIPTEQDFESPIQEDLQKYLQGATCDAKVRTQLFRLAWDISTSAFGGRQTLYERFFFGDPIRLNTSLYNGYSKERAISLAKSLLEEK